jgi:hypothetical protein
MVIVSEIADAKSFANCALMNRGVEDGPATAAVARRLMDRFCQVLRQALMRQALMHQ